MSNVLIIAKPSPAAARLRDMLTMQGYAVTTAEDLVSALPELYLSPEAMRVFLGEDDMPTGASADDALHLAEADPGPLGRHSYVTFDALASEDAVVRS